MDLSALAMSAGASLPPPLPRTLDDYSLEDEMMRQQQRDEAVATDEPEGGFEPTEDPIAKLQRWGDPTQNFNIATELSDTALSTIGMRVIEETDIDIDSRAEWLRQGKEAMDMALQKKKQKDYPWPKASNVLFPLMTQAADQFAARAYPAIIENNNIVKGVVSGPDEGVPMMDPMTGQPAMNPETQQPIWEVEPGSQAKRANRIGDHMSWQLIEEQEEWESETDTLLNVLAIIGCEFRKIYYDPDLGRNMACRVSAENLIINYWAKSMATAPRVTEVLYLYPYEIKEKIAAEFFLPGDYYKMAASSTSGSNSTTEKDLSRDRDAPHVFYEQHRRLDLDGDGYAEPYVVTVHKESMKVCRVVARYDVEDGIIISQITGKIAKVIPVQYYTKYDFMPNKEGGIYGIGFGQLLKPINESVNATLNMLIDAGHLQNTGGGFIGKNMSMHSGSVSFRPGEYKIVNAIGQSIRDSVVPLVHQGPSTVLLTLLGTLIEAGKDISSVKDVLAGELKAQTMSPTVFMALVEQGLKVFTAIYKRIHRSLKDEFEKLYRLNRIYLEEQVSYQVGNTWKTVTREDYAKGAGVAPVSDPTMVVDAQRMARTQVLAEFKDDPLCDGLEIRRRIFEAASITDIDKVLKPNPAPNPEILVKMAELELKGIASKANMLLTLSLVIKNMADADAKVMEPFMQWQQTQLEGIKNEYDQFTSKDGGSSGGASTGGPPGGPGIDGGSVPGLEAPSGEQGGAPLPGGLPGPASGGPPAQMEQPPGI